MVAMILKVQVEDRMFNRKELGSFCSFNFVRKNQARLSSALYVTLIAEL